MFERSLFTKVTAGFRIIFTFLFGELNFPHLRKKRKLLPENTHNV